MARRATRWSHEQTWVSPSEREALRSIERRLRRDGLRIEVRDREADWPYQLAAIALAAAGASLVTMVASSGGSLVSAPMLWIGAVLLLASALVGVTPVRAVSRRVLRGATRRLPPVGLRFRRSGSG